MTPPHNFDELTYHQLRRVSAHYPEELSRWPTKVELITVLRGHGLSPEEVQQQAEQLKTQRERANERTRARIRDET